MVAQLSIGGIIGSLDDAINGALPRGEFMDIASRFKGDVQQFHEMLTLQRSEAFESSWAFFPRAGGGGVAKLMVLEKVGQAFGFSRRSVAAEVFPTGENQGSADLFQGDLRIFPPGVAACAN